VPPEEPPVVLPPEEPPVVLPPEEPPVVLPPEEPVCRWVRSYVLNGTPTPSGGPPAPASGR
jgi:hypothetical protein